MARDYDELGCDYAVVCFTVNSAVNSKPEVETLLNSLTVTADRLVDVGRTLEVSVASLKEKIARARDEANRVSWKTFTLVG